VSIEVRGGPCRDEAIVTQLVTRWAPDESSQRLRERQACEAPATTTAAAGYLGRAWIRDPLGG